MDGWQFHGERAMCPELFAESTTHLMEAEKGGKLELRMPDRQMQPFVFNSPHSGCDYPPDFIAASRLSAHQLRHSEDCHVDALFSAVPALGAPLLAARFPRAWLDVNREAFELDPRMFSDALPPNANIRSPRVAGGLGAIPRIVGEGLEIYRGRIPFAEAQARLESTYKPYHETLRRLVNHTHAQFGLAVLVDCHSMPGSVRAGVRGERPDFIIGDRFGMAAASGLSGHAIRLLRGMGYMVSHNAPYAGGFITEHYGKPARGFHALQIEISRPLYMDERSYERHAGFDRLAADLARFGEGLMQWRDGEVNRRSIAAE